MSNRTVRRAGAAAVGVLLAICGTALTAPATAAPPDNRTPVIVQVRSNADPEAESRRAAANGGNVTYVYRNALRGFAGTFSDRAIENMKRNPNVTLIEPDGIATASTQTITDAGLWGLDRIDDRSGLDGSYDYSSDGTTVTAYVIDTGVKPHVDFDQLALGWDAFTKSVDGNDDCNGHGTHVAGTVAGTKYGVAKDAWVVPVKVLDCSGSGTWSGVIAGLDWVVVDHVSGPAVANMSLGGGRNSSVDSAVQRVIDDGVTVAVAAGNDGRDACNFSPARVAAAVTTGATDRTDTRASWSNFGSCLDLFAPGVGVTSAWIDDSYSVDGSSTRTISGTSMATPHVAGAAAVLLELDPAATPRQVSDRVKANATSGVVKSPGRKSPNLLLYSPPPAA